MNSLSLSFFFFFFFFFFLLLCQSFLFLHTTLSVGRYYVFNLTENQYDTSKFQHRVHWMGWYDHNAPPMKLLYEIMLHIDDWLRADPENVVVIHCKVIISLTQIHHLVLIYHVSKQAGKGRTGTAIASYLVYSGQADNAHTAIQFFAKQR